MWASVNLKKKGQKYLEFYEIYTSVFYNTYITHSRAIETLHFYNGKYMGFCLTYKIEPTRLQNFKKCLRIQQKRWEVHSCKHNVNISLRQRQVLFTFPALLNVGNNSSFLFLQNRYGGGMSDYFSFPQNGNFFGKIRILCLHHYQITKQRQWNSDKNVLWLMHCQDWVKLFGHWESKSSGALNFIIP